MSSSRKNILITGGAGFMGSHFVRHIYHARPEYNIVNLDLLTYAGNPENLRDVEENEESVLEKDKRYHFVKGDICNHELLDTLFEKHKFDLVVNFAAETHVDRSIINISDFIHTNIGGVRALMEAVRKHHTPRFVHISTDEVYGSIPEGYANEDSPLRPSNPYSASKASADLIIQAFMKAHKVPAVIIRGSNNYGPHQYPEKLIPLAISNMMDGKRVPIHGTGEHVRSWVHVKDFCKAVDLVAHKAPVCSIYNVSGEEKKNLEVLELIADHLGVALEEHREHITDRPGADFRYAPDSAKLKKDLGWIPSRSIEQSLGGVVSWYRDNQEWLKRIKSRKEFLDHYEKQSKGQWY